MGRSEFREPTFIQKRSYGGTLEAPARNLNTYVAPKHIQYGAPVGDNEAEQLARALSAAEPALGTYFKAKYQKENEAAYNEGVRLALEQNISDWASFVKSNPKYERINPYLRLGVEDQMAYLNANQASLEIAQRAKKETVGLTDPAEIKAKADSITQDIMKKYAAGLNDASAAKFISKLNASNTEIWGRLGLERLEEAVEQKYETMASGMMSAIEAGVQNKHTAADIAQAINEQSKAALALGADPKRVNEQAVNAIIGAMSNMTDEEALNTAADVLSNLTGKDDKPLISIPAYAEKLAQVRQLADYRTEQAQRDLDKNRKDAASDIVAQIIPELMSTPGADHSAALMNAATINGKLDAALFEDLMRTDNFIFSYKSARQPATARRRTGGGGGSYVPAGYPAGDGSPNTVSIASIADLNEAVIGQNKGAVMQIVDGAYKAGVFGPLVTTTGKPNQSTLNKKQAWLSSWMQGEQSEVETRYNKVSAGSYIYSTLEDEIGLGSDNSLSSIQQRLQIQQAIRRNLRERDSAYIEQNGRHMNETELQEAVISNILPSLISNIRKQSELEQAKQQAAMAAAAKPKSVPKGFVKVIFSTPAANTKPKTNDRARNKRGK